MDMVSMELKKKSKEELKGLAEPVASEQSKFPYGLRLRFEKEQIDKIPFLETSNVGDKVVITAEAVVETKEKNDRLDGESYISVCIQITDIAVSAKEKKPLEKMSPKEYRAARRSGEV
jgi:hypothetical protein